MLNPPREIPSFGSVLGRVVDCLNCGNAVIAPYGWVNLAVCQLCGGRCFKWDDAFSRFIQRDPFHAQQMGMTQKLKSRG